MSAVTIAPSKNLQLQSPLVRLPAEIKHLIFGYCFAASGPITDALPGSTRSKAEVLPGLGVNVLRTCRRIYHEADRRQIFAKNTFAFTTAERVRHFFEGLGEEYSGCVQDVEIDARKVNSNHPEIAHEWLQYLAWGSGGWTGETWGKTMGSLRMDAPGLKCLRLNFASWPSIPMSRAVLWNVLRGMISQLERLERVVVVGASEGKDMSRQNPWSPVHFVGGDDVGSEDLVELMWKAVSKPGDHKNVSKKWTEIGRELV
ncbi:hypothetical protein CC80DRAFT_556204 [Byssothecium circinans]|uniref:F-box domain-containing protein n=1 Tax=Byssothecium circinans TaxID=147558 RepID=A0A6A5TA18_9PLEO|nr:hypothetical protein CC80DRAFT_556204 [Byssothecium circinans]